MAENIDELYNELTSDPRFKSMFETQTEFEQYLAEDPAADVNIENVFGVKTASEYLKKKAEPIIQNLGKENSSLQSLSVGPTKTTPAETETTEGMVAQAPMGGDQNLGTVESTENLFEELPPLGYGKAVGVGPQTTKPPGKYSDILKSTGKLKWNKEGSGIWNQQMTPLYNEIIELSKNPYTSSFILDKKVKQYVDLYKQIEPTDDTKADFDVLIQTIKNSKTLDAVVSADGVKIQKKDIKTAPKEQPLRIATYIEPKKEVSVKVLPNGGLNVTTEKFVPPPPTEKELGIINYLDAYDRYANDWSRQFAILSDPSREGEGFDDPEYLQAKIKEEEGKVDKLIEADVYNFIKGLKSNVSPDAFDAPALVSQTRNVWDVDWQKFIPKTETVQNEKRRLLYDDGLYGLDNAGNFILNTVYLENQVDKLLNSPTGPISDKVLNAFNEKRKVAGLDPYSREQVAGIFKQRFMRIATTAAQQKIDEELVNRRLFNADIFKQDVERVNKDLNGDIKVLTANTQKTINDLNIKLSNGIKSDAEILFSEVKIANDNMYANYLQKVKNTPMTQEQLDMEYKNYLDFVSQNATMLEERINQLEKKAQEDFLAAKVQIDNTAKAELDKIKNKYGIISDKDEKNQMTTAIYRKYRDAYKKAYDDIKSEEQQNSNAMGWRLWDITKSRTAGLLANSIEALSAAVGYEDNPFVDMLKYLNTYQAKNKVDIKPFSKVIDEDGFFSVEAIKSAAQNTVQQAPNLVASTAATILTKNPYIGGGIGFVLESTEIAGENYKQSFEKFGSIVDAENAAADAIRTQTLMAPLYVIEMLPYVKGFLSKITPGTGVIGFGKKFAFSTALEIATETPVEITQNYLNYKATTENPMDFATYARENGINTSIDVAPAVAVLGGGSALMETYSERQTELAKSRVQNILGRLGMSQTIADAVQVIGDKGALIIPEYLYRTGQINAEELKDMRRAFEEVVKALPNAKTLVQDQDAQKYFVSLSTERAMFQKKLDESKDELEKRLLGERIKSIDKKLGDVAAGKPLQLTKIKFKDGSSIVVSNEQMLNEYLKNPKMVENLASEDITVETQDPAITKIVEEKKKSLEKELQEATDKGAKQLGGVQTIARETGATLEEQDKLNEVAAKATSRGQANTNLILNEAVTLQRALEQVAPGARIVFMNSEEFSKVVPQLGGKKESAGNFAYTKNEDGSYSVEVQINLDKANSTTLAHEVGHVILLRTLGSDPKLFNEMRTKLRKTIEGTVKNDVLRTIDALVNQYKTNEQAEEFLVELTATLKLNAQKLEISTLEKIAKVISDFVAYVTGGQVQIFNEIQTRADFAAFINGMADTLSTGEIAKPLQRKIDAVQEQKAGQVPVQPEAGVSQEVAEGKPKTEPQVAAEEGKKEVKKRGDFSKILAETLTKEEFNTVRASLRNTIPDSFVVEILDAIASKGYSDLGFADLNEEIQRIKDEGLTFGALVNLASEDETLLDKKNLNSKRSLIEYLLRVGQIGRLQDMANRAITRGVESKAQIQEGTLTQEIKRLLPEQTELTETEKKVLNNLFSTENISLEKYRNIFFGYKMNDFNKINSLLRKGLPISKENLQKEGVAPAIAETIAEDYDDMARVLSNTTFSPKEKITLFRSTNYLKTEGDKSQNLSDYEVGDKISDAAFVSTTIDQNRLDYEKKPLIKFELNPGDKINGTYLGGNEKEFLIDRNTEFVVKNKEIIDGNTVLTVGLASKAEPQIAAEQGQEEVASQIQDAEVKIVTPNNEETEVGDVIVSGYVNPNEVRSKSQLAKVFQPVEISWEVDPESGIQLQVPEERKSFYDVVSESGGAVVVANSDGTGIGKVVDGQILQGGIGYSFIAENVLENIGFAASDDAKIPSIWEAAQEAAKLRDQQNPEMKGSPVAVFVMVQEPSATFGNAYAATYFGNVLKAISKDKGYQTTKAKNELIEFINDFRTNNNTGRKYNDAFAELISIIRNTDFTKPEAIDKITQTLITEKKRGLPKNADRQIIAENNKRFGFDVRRAFFEKFFVGVGKANSSQPANELRNYLKEKGFGHENFFEKYVDENIMKSLQGETPGKRLSDGGFAMTGFFVDPNMSKDAFINESKTGTYQHKQFNSRFFGTNPFVLNGKYYVNEMLPEARFVSKEGKDVPVQASAAMSLYPRTRRGEAANIIERSREIANSPQNLKMADENFGTEDGKANFQSKAQYSPKELKTVSETISNRFDEAQLENLKKMINQGVTAPQNTTKAYKLFRVKKNFPGELFPLFVGANESVTTGEWIAAKAGELTQSKKGKTMVKSTLGPLAYRPGWHSGDIAVATHIGEKKNPSDKAPSLRADDQVWAEVEVGNDVDWQTEANNRAEKTKDGRISLKTAHITDQVPSGGNYKYKTNSNMTGSWIISGEMKVNRILTDAEVEQINKEAGAKDLPRTKPFDFAAYGFNSDGTIINPKQVLANQVARAYLTAKETGTNQELVDAVDMKRPQPEFKSKAQLDFTQIRPEFDNVMNQTNGNKVAAYTALVEKGYTPKRIKDAIGLYDFDETAFKQAQSQIAINTLDKIGTAFSDRQELIKQEINNNLGNVESIYEDLIAQGYSNLEIFTAARDMDFLSPQDLVDLFGAEYRQTVQNAINTKTQYPADFLDELEADARSLKVTQTASEITDVIRETGIGLVDSAVTVDMFLEYLKTNGFDQIAIALTNGVKQFAQDRGMFDKTADWVDMVNSGQVGNNMYSPEAINYAFSVSSELFSQAGRILQMARFFNEANTMGVIEKTLANNGVVLSEQQRKTLEGLVNDYKAAQKDNKTKLEELQTDWSDNAYNAFWESEKAVGMATIRVAQFLEARKPIFWNERITSGAARGLLNLTTTVLSFTANIENNIYSTNFVVRAIQKLRDSLGSGIKGNTLSISNWQMARKLTNKRMWFDMNKNAMYGVMDTSNGLNKYYDNLAQVNFFRDVKWVYNFSKTMVGKVLNRDFDSMTPEEQADAFDLTLVKLKNGDIELRDGKTYTFARSLAWTLGTGPGLAIARSNPWLLLNTGGPLLSEVTGRAMAYGGDIAFGYMAAQRAMIDYFKNIQGTRFQDGIFDTMIKDANGNLDEKAIRAMSQILLADGELYARFEEEGLKRTLLANNPISGLISLGRGGIRKKIRNLYVEERLETGGAGLLGEARRTFLTKRGLEKTLYQLGDVALFTLMPFTKVPVNFLGSAITKVVPAIAMSKYVISEGVYQYKWKQFNKEYPIGKKLKNDKERRDYEKAKIELFSYKRQATYDAAQVATSFAIYGFAMSAVQSGAILTGGGGDPEKEKALKTFGLRGGLYNASLHWEYLTSKNKTNFIARRGGYVKPGDKIINTRNAGFLGYAFNLYGSTNDALNRQEADNVTSLLNTQKGALSVLLSSSLSSSIEDLPMFQGIARIGQLLNDIKNPETEKNAWNNFAAGTLTTSMAVFFPSFFSFMSKGNAEFVQNANEINTRMENPTWAGFWGDVVLRTVQKLNRNISFNPETRNEFYEAAIGPFGEDLAYKVTVAEPGTLGAYVQAAFDPMSFRKFAAPVKEQQKQIAAYKQSMEINGGLVNLALIYNQMTGRDYEWTAKGPTSGMFGIITNPMRNKFTWAQEITMGGEDAPNIYKGFTYQLPNDLYRQELKLRGEFFRSSLERYGSDINDVLVKVQTYVAEDKIEQAKAEIVTLFNGYQQAMIETQKTYMDDYRNNREKQYLIKLKERNLLTKQEIQDMIKVGLADEEGFIK